LTNILLSKQKKTYPCNTQASCGCSNQPAVTSRIVGGHPQNNTGSTLFYQSLFTVPAVSFIFLYDFAQFTKLRMSNRSLKICCMLLFFLWWLQENAKKSEEKKDCCKEHH